MTSQYDQITQLLAEWKAGNEDAKNELFSLVYEEIREIAQQQRKTWQGNETMNTTALVNELYLKLVSQAKMDFESRRHFFAVAAKAIRHILVDYAKKTQRKKRGGGMMRIALESIDEVVDQGNKIIELSEALDLLEKHSVRLAQVFELHFFVGLSTEEIADMFQVSSRTIRRDWNKARAVLMRDIRQEDM